MPTIKLLAAAGDWAAGSVVTVDESQARRLIRTGYAVVVEDAPRGKLRTRTERTGHDGSANTDRDARVEL